MRQIVLFVLVMAVAFAAGCGGGGVSQDDMRRRAIRRPQQEDGDKPSAANQLAARNKSDVDADIATRDSQRAATAVPAKGRPPKDAATAAETQSTTATPATPPTATPPTATPPTATPPPATPQTATPPPATISSGPTVATTTAGDAAAQPPQSDSSTSRPAGVDSRLGAQPPAEPLSLEQRRQRTISNLTQIGAAIRRFCDQNGRLFGPAMCNAQQQPMVSWRVELLPYLGYQELYDMFDVSQPWDSPRNKPLLDLIPPVYQSPERFDTSTNYVVPVASFTPFGRARGYGIMNLDDGPENTALVLEVNDSDAVPWTKPADLSVDIKTLRQHVGALRDDGFFVVWGDGAITRVTPECGERDLKAILTRDGGDAIASHLVRAEATAAPAATDQHQTTDIATPAADPTGRGARSGRTGRTRGTGPGQCRRTLRPRGRIRSTADPQRVRSGASKKAVERNLQG